MVAGLHCSAGGCSVTRTQAHSSGASRRDQKMEWQSSSYFSTKPLIVTDLFMLRFLGKGWGMGMRRQISTNIRRREDEGLETRCHNKSFKMVEELSCCFHSVKMQSLHSPWLRFAWYWGLNPSNFKWTICVDVFMKCYLDTAACAAQEGKPLPMSRFGQNTRRKIQRPGKTKVCIQGGEPKPNNQGSRAMIQRICTSSQLFPRRDFRVLIWGQDAYNNKPTYVTDYNKHKGRVWAATKSQEV